jgi:cobalt-zinc-cadmium efflux system outer membrane protein
MRRVLAVIALIVAPSSAYADDRANMEAYVAEVLTSNPSLHASVLRRDAYREEGVATGKWPDPFVSVMVDRVPQAMGGDMPMIRYGVTQMLPWPGKLPLMRLVVDRQGDGAAAEVDTRKLDLRLAAERTFMMLWMNAKRRELNRSQRALASTIASAALGRYGAGLGQHHDVVRAQVEINTLDVEHIDLEGERASIIAMLNALRNRPSDVAVTDPVDVGPPSSTFALGPLVEKALATRPELRRMKAMHDESEAMAAFSRREPYPDIMTGIWANQMIGDRRRWEP